MTVKTKTPACKPTIRHPVRAKGSQLSYTLCSTAPGILSTSRTSWDLFRRVPYISYSKTAGTPGAPCVITEVSAVKNPVFPMYQIVNPLQFRISSVKV